MKNHHTATDLEPYFLHVIKNGHHWKTADIYSAIETLNILLDDDFLSIPTTAGYRKLKQAGIQPARNLKDRNTLVSKYELPSELYYKNSIRYARRNLLRKGLIEQTSNNTVSITQAGKEALESASIFFEKKKSNNEKSHSHTETGPQTQKTSIDHEEKKAIELLAMRAAEEHFSDWDVFDVSQPADAEDLLGQKHPGYDLHCLQGNEELHIEVKGTKTADSITLTENELRHACSNGHARLFTLTNIMTRRLDRTEEAWEASGGQAQLYRFTDMKQLNSIIGELDSINNQQGSQLKLEGWQVTTTSNPHLEVDTVSSLKQKQKT